jgi:hypothetical protein
MAQASGILSSTFVADGVPLKSHHGSDSKSIGKTGAHEEHPMPLRSSVISLDVVHRPPADALRQGNCFGASASLHQSPFSHLYRSMVEQVPRARYLDVSKDSELGLGEMVLFRGPSGVTLALSASEISAERVRQEIEKSERENAEGQS